MCDFLLSLHNKQLEIIIAVSDGHTCLILIIFGGFSTNGKLYYVDLELGGEKLSRQPRD
jgi:hypothetical protein